MNENNEQVIRQKSNKGVIIVLIILVIGLSCYIAYDKFKVEDTKTVVNETTDTTTKEETKTTDDNIINEETKNDSTTLNTEDLYKQFINNIKVRNSAEMITLTSNKDGSKITIVLGTDNKLYVETYNDNDTKIPGAVGSGGDYTGKYINIDGVVRIFHTKHTHSEGGSYSGLLVLKEDGNLYILRNPADNDYNLEKIEHKNIVYAYDTISGTGTTYVVDISGNQYEIK